VAWSPARSESTWQALREQDGNPGHVPEGRVLFGKVTLEVAEGGTFEAAVTLVGVEIREGA
jgi:hypothetical protein